LQRLELQDGKIVIAGRSTDGAPMPNLLTSIESGGQ
jgi:hypothetical protein